MDDIAARLERLELIEQAKVATFRYGRACDRKDVEALRTEVFTPDVVLRVPGTDHRGGDAVAAFYTQAFAAQPGTRRHFLTNQIADVSGPGEVTVDSYFFFVSEDERSVIGWGSYRDVVVIRDGAVRISDKTIVVDVFTDLVAGWAASRAPVASR
jgi:hypothetical protein